MFRSRAFRFAGHAALGLIVAVVFAVVFGWVVMLAWNAVLPELFGVPAITFWQSVAVLVLARVLTGRLTHGYRGCHGGHRSSKGHGFRKRFQCSPSRESAALYSAWWDEEGEAAFQAYAEKHLGEKDRD